MKIFKLAISNNYIYGVSIFGHFIDFRQWYYLYVDGVKDDSWFDTNELMYYFIYSRKKEINKFWFEPVPKLRSLFFRK